MPRGTEIGYPEVQNMLEDLRSEQAILSEKIATGTHGGEPESLDGRRDWIIPLQFYGQGAEPSTPFTIANVVYVALFFLDRAFNPETLAYDVSGTATATVVFGLYDEDGNKLCQWSGSLGTLGAVLCAAID